MTASLFLSCLLLLVASPAPCAEPLNLIPVPVAAHPGVDEQLLYFTSSSLFADDQRLIFMSERTDHPNIFLRNIACSTKRRRFAWRKRRQTRGDSTTCMATGQVTISGVAKQDPVRPGITVH
jgi:hypothetical protein